MKVFCFCAQYTFLVYRRESILFLWTVHILMYCLESVLFLSTVHISDVPFGMRFVSEQDNFFVPFGKCSVSVHSTHFDVLSGKCTASEHNTHF